MPVVYIQTKIGGTFSVGFIFASFITITLSILNIYYDNIIEIRGIIPTILLDEFIVAKDFSVNFTFYSYGGHCLKDNKCDSSIHYNLQGLSYSNSEIKCIIESSDCSVYLNLKNTT